MDRCSLFKHVGCIFLQWYVDYDMRVIRSMLAVLKILEQLVDHYHFLKLLQQTFLSCQVVVICAHLSGRNLNMYYYTWQCLFHCSWKICSTKTAILYVQILLPVSIIYQLDNKCMTLNWFKLKSSSTKNNTVTFQ